MWPRRDRPALWVWAGGQKRRAQVKAKQVWADGSVYYQVEVDLQGDTRVTVRLYRWPQPGLSVAYAPNSRPFRQVHEGNQGDMPHRPQIR